MTNNPGSSSSPVPGNISGNYSSHFLHFDGSTGVLNAVGTVAFNAPIVACIFKHTLLDLSDGPAGSPTTIYPTGFLNRGIATSIPSFFSISGNTLSFNVSADPAVNEIAQVRIITGTAPTPGSIALVGLGGILAARRRR
jgi:MYXO-CTERM domain-containing protein